MLAFLKFEARRLLREPRAVVLTLVLPVLVYTISSNNQGDVGGLDVAAYLMVSMAAYGVLVGVMTIGISVSQERASGWLRQLRITPLSPVKVVVSKALLGSLLAVPVVIAVGFTAVASHGVSLGIERWAALIGLLWLGSLPFAALGLALGFALTPQLTQPVSMLGVFGLSFLGGLFVPTEVMPHMLAQISVWLPSNRYAELGRAIVAHQGLPARGILILTGWAVLFGVLAVAAYRRSAAAK
jgi:ABC-2 type transport system permease protein